MIDHICAQRRYNCFCTSFASINDFLLSSFNHAPSIGTSSSHRSSATLAPALLYLTWLHADDIDVDGMATAYRLWSLLLQYSYINQLIRWSLGCLSLEPFPVSGSAQRVGDDKALTVPQGLDYKSSSGWYISKLQVSQRAQKPSPFWWGVAISHSNHGPEQRALKPFIYVSTAIYLQRKAINSFWRTMLRRAYIVEEQRSTCEKISHEESQHCLLTMTHRMWMTDKPNVDIWHDFSLFPFNSHFHYTS